MYLAKVIGNVVATQKHDRFLGMKLLLIQPVTAEGRALVLSGRSMVAVDGVGAGAGECVLFTQGSSARLATASREAPVDCVIVGIVDTVEVEGLRVDHP